MSDPSRSQGLSRVPPAGLRAATVCVGGEELLVVSFPAPPPVIESLPSSERDVAALALAGQSNAEIAAQRGTTVGTVGKQLDAVYRKLGVRGRRELAALATKD